MSVGPVLDLGGELGCAAAACPSIPVSNTKACLSACLSRNRQLPLLPFLSLSLRIATRASLSMNSGLIYSSFHRSIASSISSESTSIDVNLHSKSNRRRTLKTLFRIPLDATRSSGNDVDVDTTVMKINTSGSSLPHDIIREIVGLLSPADILNFSLTVCLLSFPTLSLQST